MVQRQPLLLVATGTASKLTSPTLLHVSSTSTLSFCPPPTSLSSNFASIAVVRTRETHIDQDSFPSLSLFVL
jgi:hypothetical protein